MVLKEDKGSEHIIAWKLRGLYKTEIYSLHNAFLPNVKEFGYKVGKQFNKTLSVIAKNNYVTKVVNGNIAYYLGCSPKN